MDLLTITRAKCQARDLIIMTLVEQLRHLKIPATPTEVAGMIKGAPVTAVYGAMVFLVNLGALERKSTFTFALTQLGAEVLTAEIEGWAPSPDEQLLRDINMASSRV